MRHGRKSMRFDKIFRAVGPVVIMAAMGGMMAGCQNRNGDFSFNGTKGVPLAELDMSGDAPTELVVLASDRVVIEGGDDFTISLQGDDEAKDAMRFILRDGTLAILREDSDWSGATGATVNVTMPAPTKITIAGSGEVTSTTLASNAEVVIAGSGRLTTTGLESENLDVTIAGSGHYAAAGTTDRLDLTVAGSGTADMPGLTANTVEISIAGSGNSIFSSDGEVSANIMGSGNVTVRGGARCTVSSMGSGSLVCERREDEAA